MKALILKRYGKPLVLEEANERPPLPHEVKIKTAYAGVSFTDIIIQKGYYQYQRQNHTLPLIPGFEASGTVEAIGENVKNLDVGDNVLVMQRFGCMSERIITSENLITKLSPHVDLKWAASIPVNFFTAYHALNNIVKIFPGSEILVTSAAGGVGGMILQLAGSRHDIMALVGHEEKREYTLKLGAREAFTYEKFSTSKKFDVILTSSGAKLQKYTNCLKQNGKLIVYGLHSLVPQTKSNIISSLFNYLRLSKINLPDMINRNITVSGFNIIKLSESSKEYLAAKKFLTDKLISEGRPSAHTISVFDAAEHQKAFEYLDSGKSCGKVLLKF